MSGASDGTARRGGAAVVVWVRVAGYLIPSRRHRYAMATLLELDETYLWPDVLSPEEVASASTNEIVHVYAPLDRPVRRLAQLLRPGDR